MYGIERLKAFRHALLNPADRVFTALLDFSYQHYALGDLLTTLVQVSIKATDAGCDQVDLIIGLHPFIPASPLQPFVTPANYFQHLDNVMPVMLAMPKLRSIKLMRDMQTLNFTLASHAFSRNPMWPGLVDHLRREVHWPLNHHDINDFHQRRGYVPHLAAPRGYADWAARFLAEKFPGKTMVVINPRQGSLSAHVNPGTLYRDTDLNEWYDFIGRTAVEFPDVVFIQVGAFLEWEYRLSSYDNVFIPRAHGLHLGHELALQAAADFFMGTSSGFAVFATFSDRPYAITNIEHYFADHAGITAGDRHYPFGRRDQILTWEAETSDQLCELFKLLHASRKGSADSGHSGVLPAADADAASRCQFVSAC